MSNQATGLIIGKFCPPHKGHRFLIDAALKETGSLTVLLCNSAADSIPAEQRLAWLRSWYPQVRFLEIYPDRFDRQSAQAWVDTTLEAIGTAPDLIFSSEAYGEQYAEMLGATHRMIDRERATVPCSAGSILADPAGNSQFIDPEVLKYLLG